MQNKNGKFKAVIKGESDMEKVLINPKWVCGDSNRA